jgi:hypothetical protein
MFTSKSVQGGIDSFIGGKRVIEVCECVWKVCSMGYCPQFGMVLIICIVLRMR